MIIKLLSKIIGLFFPGVGGSGLGSWAEANAIHRIEGRKCSNCDHGIMVNLWAMDCELPEQDSDECIEGDLCGWSGPDCIPVHDETDESLKKRILERMRHGK